MLLLAALATLLAIALTLRTGSEPQTNSAPPTTSAAPANDPEPALPEPPQERVQLGAAPQRSELAPPPRPPANAVAAAGAATAQIRGRCVDARGRPVAGCAVEALGVPAAAMPRTVSGVDGTFAFAIDTGSDAIVYAVRAEGASAAPATRRIDQLQAGSVCDLGDFAIVVGTPVSGRTVDARGEPMAGAAVTFVDATVRAGVGEPASIAVRSDAAGRFATLLLPGTWRIQTLLPRLSAGSLRVGDDDGELTIVVEAESPAAVITGTVVDAEGKPVEARVATRMHDLLLPLARTVDGAFRLPLAQGSDGLALAVEARGFERWQSQGTVPAGSDVRVVLVPSPAARLRLVDGAGRPVEQARVLVWWHDWGPAEVLDGPFADGRVPLPPLVGSACRVLVSPTGAALASTARLRLQALAGSGTEVVVPARAERRLRVQRSDGGAAVGTRFSLVDAQEDESPLHAAPPAQWRANARQPLQLQGGSTDAAGEAVLQGPADRALQLVLRGDHVETVVGDVWLRDPTPLQATVAIGATLRARLVPAEVLQTLLATWPQQAVPAKLQLELGRADEPRTASDRLRWRGGANGTFAADGSCELTQVPAGDYVPKLMLDHGARFACELPPLSLRDGEQRELAIDLAARLPAEFTGSVEVDGERLVGAEVTLRGQRQRATTGADGRFRMVASPGTFVVTITLPGEALPIELAEPIELPAGGKVDRVLTTTTRPLRLRVIDADGRAAAGIVLTIGGVDLPPTDADGCTGLPRVGPRPLAVAVWPRALASARVRQQLWSQQAMRGAQPVLTSVPLGDVAADAGTSTVMVLPAGFR